jgi:hypothetical protein
VYLFSLFLKIILLILKKFTFFFKPLIQNIFILNIFIFSALFPFDKIRNKNLMVILNKLTSYTGGVYYLHVAIANLSGKYIYLIRSRTFKGCLLIYLYCYLICFIGSFIFKKSFLKNLFI